MTSEPMEPGVAAIVAGHGDWAAGLVSAVAQITGLGALFLPLSNAGMSGEQLELALRDALDRTGSLAVFTDLPAGSWTVAARRIQRGSPALVVAAGVNLAMLLDFAFHQGSPLDAAMRTSLEKGRKAMIIAGGVPPVPPASLGGGERAD